MNKLEITAFELAQRFIGVREYIGPVHNPQVMAMLQLDNTWPQADEVPWCSAFVNYICWLLGLPRTKSLMARSWLEVGDPVNLENAVVGFDIAVFIRGSSPTAGHVGFYGGRFGPWVLVLGGNQGDEVSFAKYSTVNLLGVRRLHT